MRSNRRKKSGVTRVPTIAITSHCQSDPQPIKGFSPAANSSKTVANGAYSATAFLTVFTGSQILAITRTGSIATLTYTTFPGATNTIEFKFQIQETNWNPLNPIMATGSVMTAPDPSATNATRFYRIRTDF